MPVEVNLAQCSASDLVIALRGRQVGAREVPRDEYKMRRAQALSGTAQFPVVLAEDELESFLQSITQTS